MASAELITELKLTSAGLGDNGAASDWGGTDRDAGVHTEAEIAAVINQLVP